MEVYGRVNVYNEHRQTTTHLDAHYTLATKTSPILMIIKCGSCEEPFLAVIDPRGKGISVWPLAMPPVPEGVPEKVAEAYQDARLALAAGSKIGALLAGRTVLIRMLREQETSSLKELVEKQIVTPALYGGADQLRLWADIAGHEDVKAGVLADEEVEDVLDYLGLVLEAVYTHQARVNRFVSRTKELKGRPKKTP